MNPMVIRRFESLDEEHEERICSLLPSATEMVLAVGAGDSLAVNAVASCEPQRAHAPPEPPVVA